jgi:hypothetical protein
MPRLLAASQVIKGNGEPFGIGDSCHHWLNEALPNVSYHALNSSPYFR